MALTKKQLQIIDMLRSGSFIWRAGTTYYLARKHGEHYQSEVLNRRTFDAIEFMLKHSEKSLGVYTLVTDGP